MTYDAAGQCGLDWASKHDDATERQIIRKARRFAKGSPDALYGFLAGVRQWQERHGILAREV